MQNALLPQSFAPALVQVSFGDHTYDDSHPYSLPSFWEESKRLYESIRGLDEYHSNLAL